MWVERRSIFTRNGGRTRSRRATLLEWSATQSPMVARGERPKRVVHEMDGRHRRAVPCTTEFAYESIDGWREARGETEKTRP